MSLYVAIWVAAGIVWITVAAGAIFTDYRLRRMIGGTTALLADAGGSFSKQLDRTLDLLLESNKRLEAAIDRFEARTGK